MLQSLFSCCCLMKTLCNSFQEVQQVVLVQEKGVHKPPKTQLFMGKHITWQDAKPCLSCEEKRSTQGAVYNKRKFNKSLGSLTCTDINTHPSSAYTLNKQDIHILTRSRQTLYSSPHTELNCHILHHRGHIDRVIKLSGKRAVGSEFVKCQILPLKERCDNSDCSLVVETSWYV